MSFTDVTGTWTQPAVTCPKGKTSSVALWVGLGGYSLDSPALEQTGTEVDCDVDGSATYYAWYELVPADSVTLKMKVNAGDTITSSVVAKSGRVLVQMKNRTRHWTFTKWLNASQLDLTSAEWITEAPSQCAASSNDCTTLPLAKFTPVKFSRIAATGNGSPGTLTNSAWLVTQFKLVPLSQRPQHSGRFFGDAGSSSGTSGATATDTVDGTSFTVGWVAKPSG